MGPEALEDWLHASLRDPSPQRIAEARRIIGRHCLYLMEQRWPELFADLPPIQTRKIWKGDPKLEIRCVGPCGEVKTAGDNFYRRMDTTSGWGQKCKQCQKELREKKAAERNGMRAVQGPGPRELRGPAEADGSPGRTDPGRDGPDGVTAV